MRQIERRQKFPLGFRRSLGAVPLKNELAFDAQEFGQIPAFIARFATRQRIVDDREALCDLAGFPETCREFAERHKEARQEPGITRLFEFTAQNIQSRGDVRAAFSQHHAVEAARP